MLKSYVIRTNNSSDSSICSSSNISNQILQPSIKHLKARVHLHKWENGKQWMQTSRLKTWQRANSLEGSDYRETTLFLTRYIISIWVFYTNRAINHIVVWHVRGFRKARLYYTRTSYSKVPIQVVQWLMNNYVWGFLFQDPNSSSQSDVRSYRPLIGLN